MALGDTELDTICQQICRSLGDYCITLVNPVSLALSGGKDSTVLALCLRSLGYDVRPIIIDLGYRGFDAKHIESNMASLGMRAAVVDGRSARDAAAATRLAGDYAVIADATHASPCSACSRIKRHFLAEAMTAIDARFIAFGHHRDDFLVTMLKDYYAASYYTEVGTYRPVAFADHIRRTSIDLGALREMVSRREAATMGMTVPLNGHGTLVRPLAYTPEASIVAVVRKLRLPVVGSGCSHEVFTAVGRVPVTKREIVHAHLNDLLQQDPHLGDRLLPIALQSLDAEGRPVCSPRRERARQLPGFDGNDSCACRDGAGTRQEG